MFSYAKNLLLYEAVRSVHSNFSCKYLFCITLCKPIIQLFSLSRVAVSTVDYYYIQSVSGILLAYFQYFIVIVNVRLSLVVIVSFAVDTTCSNMNLVLFSETNCSSQLEQPHK